jgi:UDP-N-acetyl-D-galactosamine dehydrogenase
VKGMIEKQKVPNKCKVLVLGLTFKENCPDVRNTKVKDIVDNFKTLGVKLDIYDPRASKEDIRAVFNHNSLDVIDLVKHNPYDAVIIAVNHSEFDYLADGLWIDPGQIIFDVKGMLTAEGVMTL